jgi:hypothetical protein
MTFSFEDKDIWEIVDSQADLDLFSRVVELGNLHEILGQILVLVSEGLDAARREREQESDKDRSHALVYSRPPI